MQWLINKNTKLSHSICPLKNISTFSAICVMIKTIGGSFMWWCEELTIQREHGGGRYLTNQVGLLFQMIDVNHLLIPSIPLSVCVFRSTCPQHCFCCAWTTPCINTTTGAMVHVTGTRSTANVEVSQKPRFETKSYVYNNCCKLMCNFVSVSLVVGHYITIFLNDG